MSLISEILENYVDANGLVSPSKCLPTNPRASDNGLLYTGEFYALLAARGELDNSCGGIAGRIRPCQASLGLYNRSPRDTDPEAPDDYYGLAAGLGAFGTVRSINYSTLYNWGAICAAFNIVRYGCKHFGSFNNVNPGKWTWQSFFWRQPQLIVALYAAANRAPRWQLPFRIYTASIIATACMFTPPIPTESTPRRLTWLLIQATQHQSWLCRVAAKVWWRRLRKQYGDPGMRAVNSLYFPVGHPLATYAVNPWDKKP